MTNALPYYPRYPRDFFEGTAGMSLEEKGAYGLVLDLIYMMGERGLPDDPQYIAGQLGASVRKWNALRKSLIEKGKIYSENGIISNKRADNLKINQRKYRDNQAENARGPRKNNNLAKPPPTSREEPEPNTKKKEPKGSKDTGAVVILSGIVSQEMAQAFADHRRAMKKPMTEQAAKALVSKLDGHHDPGAVLNDSIANGWQGVFPEKIKPQFSAINGGRNGQSPSKSEERSNAFVSGARGAS